MPGKKKSAADAKTIDQYTHTDKSRVNNPPVGLVTPDTDATTGKRTYAYDPHLDPQLQWAGKAERTAFDIPTVSLHVHERIDPRTIIEAVCKVAPPDQPKQPSLFESVAENPPLRQAIEFYKHKQNWSNRLIAGDSLLIMSSLAEKEGLSGKVQTIYFDPPYGIRYGSNFQPFVNKRDVKDGKDEDLTSEPETLKAFRDTWELGIHSYLTYLRDRLLLARELLHESGSVFVQISDENVHLVRNLMDEVFGANNFIAQISFSKAAGGLRAANRVGITLDYLVWYSKNDAESKYRPIYEKKADAIEAGYTMLELKNGTRRAMTKEEKQKISPLPEGSKTYMTILMTKPGPGSKFEIEYNGKKYDSGKRWWGITKEGVQNVIKANRVAAAENSFRFITYFDDFPYKAYTNLWDGLGGPGDPIYVVQTNSEVIKRCILMTSDPGDLVLDITCGSGTTAYVAEQWGRRWITCDTSRVAIALARQRLMTATFDYYELAHPADGVGGGFKYKTVPHVTLKSIANNEPPAQETLYDKPTVDAAKRRVTGPFTVEAVPALTVEPPDAGAAGADQEFTGDAAAGRTGETLRQAEWRDELARTGVRGRRGERLAFSSVEPLPGVRRLHAVAETKPSAELAAQRVAISFGPAHQPMSRTQVEEAWQEARRLYPKPDLLIFAAFQFDPEAAKDIEETQGLGMTLLKAQMNADLLTEDLKKKRATNESFWLIGQPDVEVRRTANGECEVEVRGFDYYDPVNGKVESGEADNIALWLLDTDYDGRSLFPRQAFFPQAGEKDGWAKLAKNLKGDIDPDLIEAYRGVKSLPFTPGKRIAVKIVDDRGIESVRVLDADAHQ
jgi:adenine-specific DNA-methyltransferase